MPRHTHPPARGGHSRAHIRFHRDRILLVRWRQAKRLLGPRYRDHPEDLRYRGGPIPRPALDLFTKPLGLLADEQAWLGCRRSGCLLCEVRPDPGRERRREERRWRADWDDHFGPR